MSKIKDLGRIKEMGRMDDIKIGPDGQTFGQLKQAVISTRQDVLSGLLGADVSTATMEAHQAAVAMLRAAYARVGLPYKTP